MSNRTRKARGLIPVPPEPPSKDRLARWRRFTHRGTNIEFVPTVTVEASNPEELGAATNAEIIRRTKDEPEN